MKSYSNNQLRQDAVTNEWVVFAPGRTQRPHDVEGGISQRRKLPAYDLACPFCPGNERMLDEIVLELPNRTPGKSWGARVVSNRYPAFVESADSSRRLQKFYPSMGAYGKHEVVIETPEHNHDLRHMSLSQIATVIEAYRLRFSSLMGKQGIAMVSLFRNHGHAAGTSLIHPHAQIIATPVVPRYIRDREERAQRYFDDTGSCIYCDLLDSELRDGRRVIAQTMHFGAFIPFAAATPYETWIIPRTHNADFGKSSPEQGEDLAGLLRDILSRMARQLDDPDYNLVGHSGSRHCAGQPHLHWYVRITPRLLTRAGFEIGSGMAINPSFPEDNALDLNSITPSGES